MKRCSRCVLPDVYPGIQFDQHGVCNICRGFDSNWKSPDYNKLESNLKGIFDSARSKKRKYDCIVPINGGKDSTYVLYTCSKIHNLNVLALNFDNGFQSDLAKQNMETVVRKLNVDFVSHKPNWNVLKMLYSCFLLKTGDFCAPCNIGIKSTAFKIAKEMEVPLIVLGAVLKFDLSPPGSSGYSLRTFKSLMLNEIDFDELKDFLHPSFMQRIFTRYIYLPSYIEWNKEQVTKTIKKELGWKESHDHFDCLVSPISNYLRQHKYGFARPTCVYSAMIRHGQMTREEALGKIGIEETGKEPANLEEFLQWIDVTKDDLDAFEKRSHLQHLKGLDLVLVNYKSQIRSALEKIGILDKVL